MRHFFALSILLFFYNISPCQTDDSYHIGIMTASGLRVGDNIYKISTHKELHNAINSTSDLEWTMNKHGRAVEGPTGEGLLVLVKGKRFLDWGDIDKSVIYNISSYNVIEFNQCINWLNQNKELIPGSTPFIFNDSLGFPLLNDTTDYVFTDKQSWNKVAEQNSITGKGVKWKIFLLRHMYTDQINLPELYCQLVHRIQGEDISIILHHLVKENQNLGQSLAEVSRKIDLK